MGPLGVPDSVHDWILDWAGDYSVVFNCRGPPVGCEEYGMLDSIWVCSYYALIKIIMELFSISINNLCTFILRLNQFFLFVSVKTFITTVDVLNAHGTFWFYSVIAFIGVIFVIFVVPETANLNSGEIEDIFENRSHKNGKKKGRHGSFDESTF